MTASDKRIAIRLVGVTGKEQTIVNVALQLLRAQQIDYDLVDKDADPADLMILDSNSDEGRTLLDAPLSACHIIVYGGKPTPPSAKVRAIHPLRVQQLLETIIDFASTAPASPTRAPAERQPRLDDAPRNAKPAPTNEGCLRWLIQMRTQQTTLHAVLTPTVAIWIDGAANTFHAIQNFERVREEIDECNKPPQVRPVDAATFVAATAKLQRHGLDNLIWRVAQSPRHAVALPPNQTVKLKGWPNFTRLGVREHELRLAALLARQAMTVAELERASGCSQQDIVGFCNAARWFGLLQTQDVSASARPAAGVVAQASPQGSQNSLLGRLARRLSNMMNSREPDERIWQ